GDKMSIRILLLCHLVNLVHNHAPGADTGAGRQKTMNVSSAARPNPPVAAAIGTAVAAPARPTSGAATAPIENCTTPNNAAALPAAWALLSASVVAFGAIRPKLAMITNSDGSIPTRPIPLSTTTS